MVMCPLCNSLKTVNTFCPKCNSPLDDTGKVSDYFDPYGHYNDEETVKMGDGYPNTAKDNICPHLIVCPKCGYEKVEFIKEV